MLSLSERVSRQRSLRNWGTFLLALTVVFSAIPFAGLSPSAVAQEEQPAAADPAPPADGGGGGAESEDDASLQSRNFLTWMIDALGWFWMLVFAALSFVMVALIMMNLLQVRRDVLLPNDFVEEFEQKLNGKDFQGAYEIARNDDSFVARVLASGMGRLSRGYPEAVEGMQEAGEDENMALEHRLSFLALIGTVAPMLGLMGTVWGMIQAFLEFEQKANPQVSELAPGIYRALITTLLGLGVAVPSLSAFAIFRNRIDELAAEATLMSEHVFADYRRALQARRSNQERS